MFAGFTIGKDYGTPSGGSTDLNNPNNLINFAGELNYDQTYQLRAGFSYLFPGKIEFSGSLRENSGLPQARTFTVTQSIVPGLTQVTQGINVAAPGAFRYPWQNLSICAFPGRFKIRERVGIEPLIDLYNTFNSSAMTSDVTAIGPSLGKPSNIDMGRLLRLGGRITF